METTKERKSFIIILGFIGIFFLISYTQAQPPQSKQLDAPYLDERISSQSKRIDQGSKGGHLTHENVY